MPIDFCTSLSDMFSALRYLHDNYNAYNINNRYKSFRICFVLLHLTYLMLFNLHSNIMKVCSSVL